MTLFLWVALTSFHPPAQQHLSIAWLVCSAAGVGRKAIGADLAGELWSDRNTTDDHFAPASVETPIVANRPAN